MPFLESMAGSDVPLVAAFFIGFMMSISPCTLASNVTAIAYVSKRMGGRTETLAVGLLYTLGRMATYVVLASLIVYAGQGVQNIALPLQMYGGLVLGIVLIGLGLVMLEAVKLPSFSFGSEAFREKIAEKGYVGGFLLGMLYALAFCPIAAVLFFAMLIPLSVRTGDALLVPAVFAFATGLPVMVFSVLFVSSVSYLSKAMNAVQTAERWVRISVAFLFILAGLYYLAVYFAGS